MEEFNEELLNSLIQEALKEKGAGQTNPFSTMHIGYGESDLLQVVSERLSDYLPESSIVSLMQEVRTDLVARKSKTTVKDLHTITKNCKKCAFNTIPELPKWNVTNPEVVIIIESPSMDPQAISFLVDKVKLAGFKSDQLCLTYVNRCPKNSKYESKEILNCASYLHSELQLLSPKIIVPMGSLPTSVLLGTDIKIKDYRGNLIWLGYWPVMPMYSPSYAARSEVPTQQFVADLSQIYKYINNISN
jgi:uracil-DNA glycosylase family 4